MTVFRMLESNGVKIGQIDVIQYGDHRFPTETFTINVPDSTYCRILLEQLEVNPLPLIRCILWLEVAAKGELKVNLIQLVEVNNALIEMEDSA
ncbi:hypothetical protein [Paenibacillus ehimensis]|uniref:Uncharacterized protein n=1 Tax=Paenibacillus ehimensis TaxID=79264 RepID=A0ABT8VM81_9BACL|nr:hypothetical protein [Paenibacillus ehimensis]MDO3682094.1 hypothetical protein [Paenibacillus ehimensis]